MADILTTLAENQRSLTEPGCATRPYKVAGLLAKAAAAIRKERLSNQRLKAENAKLRRELARGKRT